MGNTNQDETRPATPIGSFSSLSSDGSIKSDSSKKYAIDEPVKLSGCGWFSKLSQNKGKHKKTRTDYLLAMFRSNKIISG